MSRLTHYRYIDALRGVAFLCVLTVHASLGVAVLPGRAFANAGGYGVWLFFLLSAVTLMHSVSRRSRQERLPVRNYFIRRLFRIAPLFWCGIIFYLLVNRNHPNYAAPNGLKPWHFICTFLFIHGWTPSSINSVVPGGWSIAAEMTFYLLLPTLSHRLKSFWPASILCVCALVASIALNAWVGPTIAHWTPKNEQYLVPIFLLYWFPTQVPVFILGIVVYFCLNDRGVMAFLARPGATVLLVAIACSVFIGIPCFGDPVLLPAYFCYSLAFAITILTLAARPLGLIVNRFTCALGEISFSCYITHFAALKTVEKLLASYQLAIGSPALDGAVYFLLIWFSGLGLTVICSQLTYRLIEKPGMAIGDMLIQRSEASATAKLADSAQTSMST